MKLSNLRYFVSQAFRSVIRNGLMSVTSIFTVLCCMIILGLFLVVSINVNYIADQVQDQCEVQAYMAKDSTPEQLSQAKQQIEKIENVAAVEPFTKQDTLNYMREIFEDQASMLDGYENDNPFDDSLKISLVDLSKSAQTVAQIEKVSGIASVSLKQEMMDTVLNVTNMIKNMSFWVMLLLGIVSIFIIANTIKLAVYARRKEINVMKFVGATNWFIRWPFVFEGIIIGVTGALVAFGLISWGYAGMLSWISGSGFRMDMFQFKTYQEIWWVLLCSFVGIGAVIGATGSALSIRKHLDV